MEIVKVEAMCSMERAIRECKQEKEDPEVSCGYHILDIPVQSLCLSPSFIIPLQWVICDARHDSTSNAYHTTVPCLMGTTHKIAAVQTLSRETHRVAQTREVDATMLVLEQATDRGMSWKGDG